ALELLARRAGISLDSIKKSPHGPSRALMLDVMRWAAEQFQACLLDSPLADSARNYLGQRKLTGESVRRFGLGFAPESWDWLVNGALAAKMQLETLEQVGLIAKRNDGASYYDRFRGRVIFPIRDVRGQTVGFGGRILPSAADGDGPKYYNSAETPLFSKSEQLYGIDQARQAATKAGYLAVVEGYTDVMMAHQHGIGNVVATMGTALNARHIKKLRGLVERVVLVFDADAGGEGGVDRALEVFVSHDMDLRVATLPEGLDPCDLLAEKGPAPFQAALDGATDVFEFKLNGAWKDAQTGIEGQRRAVEGMLNVLAAAPEERTVKMELMVNRIAHRLNLKEETVWTRLKELRGRRADREAPRSTQSEPAPERKAPAAKHEVELLEVLLAEGAMVAIAIDQVATDEMEHPGLKQLLEGLYRLHAEGVQPGLDHLRGRLDNEKLLDKAREFQERGLLHKDRSGYLQSVLARFEERRSQRRTQDLKSQVQVAGDHDSAVELLRQLPS
ncbi:MAG: toprim domain-containing protein, partial [Planctomycetes bacterium]|nr:toprim domain-containing protein [Planctomycetota bacterium]